MNKIKEYFRFFLINFELLSTYFNDYIRFNKFNFNKNQKQLNKKQIESWMIKTYHSIEKGLSQSEFRYGFGESTILKLITLIELFDSKQYAHNLVYEYSINSLNNYLITHDNNNSYKTVQLIRDYLSKKGIEGTRSSSTKKLVKNEILDQTRIDFKSFVESRHSIRDYEPGEVSNADIVDCIKLALKTPSVCNRQGWKVRILTTPNPIKALRENQNGNQNWGHLANKFLVITHDINTLNSPRERNQGYVDGGLFAMSLLFALHSKGIATCSLSASLSKRQNLDLRKKIDIKDNENIIMFISIGNYREEFIVPASSRLNVSDFYEIL